MLEIIWTKIIVRKSITVSFVVDVNEDMSSNENPLYDAQQDSYALDCKGDEQVYFRYLFLLSYRVKAKAVILSYVSETEIICSVVFSIFRILIYIFFLLIMHSMKLRNIDVLTVINFFAKNSISSHEKCHIQCTVCCIICNMNGAVMKSIVRSGRWKELNYRFYFLNLE